MQEIKNGIDRTHLKYNLHRVGWLIGLRLFHVGLITNGFTADKDSERKWNLSQKLTVLHSFTERMPVFKISSQAVVKMLNQRKADKLFPFSQL